LDRIQIASLVLIATILSTLAACTAIPPAATVTPVAPAAASAQQALAGELGVDPAAVAIVSVEPVDWSDACLGAGGPAEICAQVVTPGYRVTLEAGGATYVYHTDATGAQLRPAPAPEPAAACAPGAEAPQVLTDIAHGYCLAYPAGYEIAQPNPAETVLYVGSLLDVAHPKLFIRVEDARGRTAEQVADDVVSEATGGQSGFIIDRTAGLTLGDEPAVRLDGVPGQDLSRQVIAVHDGRGYRLTFVPDDASQGEVYRAMEALYALVMGSFRFVPAP
jgi:hypothetical protein